MKYLKEKKNSNKAEFIVLYGRRRVGKTELVKEFLEDGVYHLVSSETSRDQIKEFKQNLQGEVQGIEDLKDDWLTIFKNLAGELDTLIIDEFQYLIESDKEILKKLQKAWDEHLKQTNITLVITGSSIGMMENEVLNYKSPLYGRRTGQWLLEPLKFSEATRFLPNYSTEQKIKAYAVLGGTPFYLNQFTDQKTVLENIEKQILTKGEILNEEAESLLKQELRSPKNYFSILKSVAEGKNRFNEIQNETSIQETSLSKYTKTLRNLHLLEKELPITASKKSRRGRYKIKDNYYSFWFRYILPNKSSLQQNPEKVKEKIGKDLDRYIGTKFEQIAHQILIEQKKYDKIGRWWYKEDEIDVVGLNSKKEEIMFGECKWTNQEVGTELLAKLEEKSQKVRWQNQETRTEKCLFSKNGFTKQLKDKAKERDDMELYNLEKIEKILQ